MHPKLNLSPSSGSWGRTLLRDDHTAAHSGTQRANAVALDNQIPASSTKKRKEDKIQNPPQTIDLLKNWRAHRLPDPSTNFDETQQQVVLGTKHVRNRALNELDGHRLTEISGQTAMYLGAREPLTTPVHDGNGINFLHPMPGSPVNFRQPVFARGTLLVPNPNLYKRLSMPTISSHRARQSDSASVQVAIRKTKRPINFADTHANKRQLTTLEMSRTDSTYEGSSLRPKPNNVVDSVVNPSSTNGLASRQKEIVTEPVRNPQPATALESLPSSTRNAHFRRLEFTHEVLETRSPLSEDKPIIDEIKAFNPTKKKLVIYENEYDDAFVLFGKCYELIRDKAQNFKAKYGKKTKKAAYLQDHFNKLRDNRTKWIDFWNQRAKLNLVNRVDPAPQSIKRMERLCLIFLFYVEMIDVVLPKSQGISFDEHPNCLEIAFNSFQRYWMKHKGPKMSNDHDSTLIWKILCTWIRKSGRHDVQENFLQDRYRRTIFQVFFNKLFCLSIENFNSKISKE
ncbi:hypothetical protein PtB15_1B731 [Puccinia triticina]|nr:hypothetical protein PtB15_1B731 [Puccinia triticina]